MLLDTTELAYGGETTSNLGDWYEWARHVMLW